MFLIIVFIAVLSKAKGEVSNYSLVNRRGIQLSGTKWTPNGVPLGLVYISHGYAEHMEYYHQLGNALARSGLFAFGHDHEGHGLSGGERVNIADFQYYVNDVFKDIHQQTKYFPGLPVFIFGHSMGGTVALLATMENQHFFKGMVLTGPFIRSIDTHGPLSSFNRVFSKVASVLSPSLQAGSTINPKDVTRNNQITRRIEEDDLFWKGKYKAKLVAATFRALDKINKNFGKVVIPLLVVHGSDDVLTMPEGSKALVAGASSRDKQLLLLEGKKHHVILDIGGDQVINSIVQWIEGRL